MNYYTMKHINVMKDVKITIREKDKDITDKALKGTDFTLDGGNIQLTVAFPYKNGEHLYCNTKEDYLFYMQSSGIRIYFDDIEVTERIKLIIERGVSDDDGYIIQIGINIENLGK